MTKESTITTLYWPRGLCFWKTRRVYARGPVVEGERHGVWQYWYRNGQKQLEGAFNRGKKTETWTKWWENGTKMTEGCFLYGKMNGKWTDWYDNGQKVLESYWELGRRDGAWTYWKRDGSVDRRETYDRHNERDMGYSIHTDFEMQESVRKIQREQIGRTWERLVGKTVAQLVKPWQAGCWVLLFVPLLALMRHQGRWRGTLLAAIVAFVTISILSWAFQKKD